MPELFADTSRWGNLVDPTQPFHALAATIDRNFVLMRWRGIPEALTTDHHFEQGGFVHVLK